MFSTINRTLKKIRRDGLKKTYRASFSHLYDMYFDKKYNLDTVKWISREDLMAKDGVLENYGDYQGTNAFLVKRVLKRLKLAKDQTFVDLGSGKGRILLLARLYGFKSIKGIEFSKELCEISQKNIEAFHLKTGLKSNIEVLNIDATSYTFEATDSVIFMYNPFNGATFEQVVINLKDSLKAYPRKLTIIYMNPTEAATLEKHFAFSSIQKHTWNEDYRIYTLKK